MPAPTDDSNEPQLFLDPASGKYYDADNNEVDPNDIIDADTDAKLGLWTAFGATAEATEKREATKARRQREKALRSQGNAKRLRRMAYGFIALTVLMLFTTLRACGSVTESDVNSLVDERLLAQGSDFPIGQSVMWSGQVITTWGNWDASKAKARQTLLSPFLSQGMDAQAGWNGKGTQQVLQVFVSPQPEILNANRAIITGTYMVGDGSWRCVALKVFATKPRSFSTTAMYAFTLAGNPTPIACNATTGAQALPSNNGAKDQQAAAELQQKVLPGFFAAWASSDQATLGQYLDDGVKTVGLGGAFRSDPRPVIEAVTVPGEGKDKTAAENTVATVTVSWTMPDGKSGTQATYNVPMHRKGGQWFVAGEPAPAPQDPNVAGNSAANNNNSDQTGGDGSDDNPTDGSRVYPTPSTTPQPTPTTYAPGGITTAPSTTSNN